MGEPNNTWIGDFHKALEERKEPVVEIEMPAEPAAPTAANQGLADWVKKMGGTMNVRPDDISYFNRVVAPQIEEQWGRIAAEVFDHAFEPPTLVTDDELDALRAMAIRAGERSMLSHMDVVVTKADQDLADMCRYTDGGERPISPALMADIARVCAIARACGFPEWRPELNRLCPPLYQNWGSDLDQQSAPLSLENPLRMSYDTWRKINASSSAT